MPPRKIERLDDDDWMGGANRQGDRGLEPDFGGPGTSPNYHGGTWVEQRVARQGTPRRPGPYVGRGPKSYTRSDEAIHEDVCEELTRAGHVDATDIEVHVQRGEVTLAGSVADREQKRLAEDHADLVPGVVDVHNRLLIRRLTRAGATEILDEEEDEPEIRPSVAPRRGG